MSTNDPAHWAQIKALFEQVQELPAALREAALHASGASTAVQGEVRSLLAHAAQSTGERGFLGQPAGMGGHGDTAGRIGQRLGPWQIVAPLGAGGMGEVFEAHRADGAFEGRAAVKLLKQGMDSALVLQRFAQERQALARLNHPHIAHLYDAGLSADGAPYFVMELVRGVPIDLAAKPLALEARLALFLQLADAVAHAHRNLLVHRDLKPGNVLVSEDGQVKLLDFGIAKAVDPLEGADANQTLASQRPFTPHYASPEQVRGEPVSTATDIYSLGVLLYQLLTGVRPTGRNATTAAAAARSVLDEQPTRPSALSPDVVADPGWLHARRKLQGDLDNILMKALQKPIEQRYLSVDALAADVRAYQRGYPISARAPSLAYLLARFLARNRASTVIAALGLAGIVAALVAALWQAQAAERSRLVAEARFAQVRQLANGLVFKYHDQIAHLPGSLATREALLNDAVNYLDGLRAQGDAALDPSLAREVAESYFRVAVLQGEQFSPSQERLGEAETNLAKALALQPRYVATPGLPAPALLSAADMWFLRSTLMVRSERLAQSLEALTQARALVERALEPGPNNLETLSRLATLEGHIGLVLGGSGIGANLGRPAEAQVHLRRSATVLAGLHERAPEVALWAHQAAWGCQNLANSLILSGAVEEALLWAQRSQALRDEAARRDSGNAHYRHQRAAAAFMLMQALSFNGKHDEALAAFAIAQAIARATVATDPANKAAARDLKLLPLALGRTLMAAQQIDAARRVMQPLLADLPTSADGDFYLERLRAEALLWLARAMPPAQATVALAHAKEAAALMAERAGGAASDNAVRQWARAQALGEQAAAYAKLGEQTAMRSTARAALDTWRAAPGGHAPGMYARWELRDQALAQR